MKLAPQHIEGTPEHRIGELMGRSEAYVPTCAWPNDCMVQWGHGLIPAVPFFEAFPPGTFIRGEGATVAEAEHKAFAQFEREHLCQHLWGRLRPGREIYLNGAGWCRKCKAFRGKMFREIVVLGHLRKQLSVWELDWLKSMEEDHEMNERMDQLYPRDAPGRRKAQKTLRVRLNLFGSAAPHPVTLDGPR